MTLPPLLRQWKARHADDRAIRVLAFCVGEAESRYTTCDEYINDSVELDVITYKKGRWGVAGLFGYMTTHDRANDIRG